jgi:phosphorylcholine metabolism protein LicD
MDIKKLIQEMNNATTEDERKQIEEKINNSFSSLTADEQQAVRDAFVKIVDDRLQDASELIKKTDVFLAMHEISKYVSLSRIAKDYFGKSREWLYQRINGYNVNGKPAVFTDDERRRLSKALEDISHIAHNTSLKIS